jgi:hypothetical protein
MEIGAEVVPVPRMGLLGEYHLDLRDQVSAVESGGFGPMDRKGIPLVDYDRLFRGRTAADGKRAYGVHYTPVTIAQYGLGSLNRYYSTGDPESCGGFLRQADWLLENLDTTPQGFGVWLHQFEFPAYQLKPPWVSAMAQGQGMSVLLRAHELTNDQKYLDAASRAFGSFLHDISEGGVCTYDGEDSLWLEEFPSCPPSRVLNGFIFALWGVLDLYRVTGDSRARDVWQGGLHTLKTNLHRYERVFWSCYDLLRRTISSLGYHQLHVLQLDVLSQLTGEQTFAECARRWQAYADGQYRLRRLVMRKAVGALRRAGLSPSPAVVGISIHSPSG